MNINNSLDDLIKNSKVELSKVQAPEQLWSNIEKRISNQHSIKFSKHLSFVSSLFDISTNKIRVFAFVNAVILGLLIIKSILNPQLISIEQTGRLAIKLDDKILNEYQKYENVIDGYQIDYLDQNIISNNRKAFPYIERLVSLDNTITKCHTALDLNPYSVNVNKSLIAAYRKKISTLDQLNTIIRSTS